jgi:hypothetical protein
MCKFADFALGAALGAVGALALAATPLSAETPRDSLVMALQIADLITLDPAEVFEFTGAEYAANVYDRLVTYLADDVDPIARFVAAFDQAGARQISPDASLPGWCPPGQNICSSRWVAIPARPGILVAQVVVSHLRRQSQPSASEGRTMVLSRASLERRRRGPAGCVEFAKQDRQIVSMPNRGEFC